MAESQCLCAQESDEEKYARIGEIVTSTGQEKEV